MKKILFFLILIFLGFIAFRVQPHSIVDNSITEEYGKILSFLPLRMEKHSSLDGSIINYPCDSNLMF